MSTKNSIKVGIKVRPAKEENCWRIVQNSIQLLDSQSEPYYFDHIFNQDCTNLDIFEKMAKHIVHSSLQGFNGTIFAYGQTSSGKTYTMMGDDENPGVMVLAAKEIFSQIEKIRDRQFLLRVGYIEIYNEKIYDLFSKVSQEVKIHETATGISVNCQDHIITSEESLLEYLRMGSKERTVGETNMNERSSRSHAIFRIIIESRKMDSKDDAIAQCVLNLVDLAGSERADQTGARGTRLKEGGHINKSLLFLSNVIKRLSENEDDKYISFRDSKLTRILQASLGGNALTSIICTIKPNAVDETQSTLNFALRAKTIKNKPKINEIVSEATMMKRLENEIKMLKSCLEKERSRNENQIKVGQLEQHLHDKVMKIISGYTLNNERKNCGARRRTWCTTASMDKMSELQSQPTALLKQPSVGRAPLERTETHVYYEGMDHVNVGSVVKNNNDKEIAKKTDLQQKEQYQMLTIDEHNEDYCSPNLNNCRPVKLTQPSDDYKALWELAEKKFNELDEFTNLEKQLNVEHDVYGAMKAKVDALTQEKSEYEKERLKYVELIADLDWTNNQLEQRKKRCTELESELTEKCNKLETELRECKAKAQHAQTEYEENLTKLQKENANLEMLSRETVSLEFEYEQYRNKSKVRETDLLSALEEKTNEIDMLQQKFTKLRDEQMKEKKKSIKLPTPLQCSRCEEFEALQACISTMRANYEALQVRYDQLQIEYEQLQGEYQTTQECSGRLQQDNVVLQQEISTLKCRFEEIQATLLEDQNLQHEYDELQKEYDILSAQLMDNVQESEGMRNELTAKEKQQQSLELELTMLRAQLLESQQVNGGGSLKSSGISVNDDAHDDDDEKGGKMLLPRFKELSQMVQVIEFEHGNGMYRSFVAITDRDLDAEADVESVAISAAATPTSALKLRISNIENVVAALEGDPDYNVNATNEVLHLYGRLTNSTFCIANANDVPQDARVLQLTAEVNELQNNYTKLQVNNAMLQEKNTKLQQNNDELHEKNKKLFSEREDLVESTEPTINELRDQIARLTAEVFEKSTFLERCTCDDYQRQLEQLELERDELAGQCTNLQEQVRNRPSAEALVEYEMRCRELQERCANIESQKQSIDDELLRVREQLANVKDQLEMQKATHKDECARLQLELLEKLELHENEARERLRNCSNAWDIDRQQYEEQLSGLRVEITVLQEQQQALAKNDNKATGNMVEIMERQQEQLLEATNEIAALKEQIQTQMSDLQRNRQQYDDFVAERLILSNEKQKCLNDLQQHVDELERLKVQCNHLLEEKSKLANEQHDILEQMQSEHEHLRDEKKQLELDYNECKDQLEKQKELQQQQNEQLEAAIDSQKNVFIEREKLQEKVCVLEKDISVQRAEHELAVQQLREQLSNIEERAADEHQQWKLKSADVQNQLAELKYQHESLRTTYEQLLTSKNELAKELAQMQKSSDTLYEQLEKNFIVLLAEYHEARDVTWPREREELHNKIAGLNGEKQTYVLKVEQLELINCKQKEAIDQLIARHEQDRSNIVAQKDALQQKFDELNKQLNEVKAIEHTKLEEKLVALEQQNAMQRTELERAMQQLDKEKQHIADESRQFQRASADAQSQLNELKYKHASLQATYDQLQASKNELAKQLEKVQESSDARHEQLTKQIITLKAEFHEARDVAWPRERQELHNKITTLSNDKQSLEQRKQTLEKIVKKYESDLAVLQSKLNAATAASDCSATAVNTSSESTVSDTSSPRPRRSIDRIFGENLQLKATSSALFEEKRVGIQQKQSKKDSSDRKNRRLQTHDERRRQSDWSDTRDVAIMTDPTDVNCNCTVLNTKLQECERNLFIRVSQVDTLKMQIKNHPSKIEIAELKKCLQEQKQRHHNELAKYRQQLADVHAAQQLAAAAEQHVVAVAAASTSTASKTTQTEPSFECDYNELYSKYEELKNICRFRYKQIADLEKTIADKENASGNIMLKYETLEKELFVLKKKYQHAKQRIIDQNKKPTH